MTTPPTDPVITRAIEALATVAGPQTADIMREAHTTAPRTSTLTSAVWDSGRWVAGDHRLITYLRGRC